MKLFSRCSFFSKFIEKPKGQWQMLTVTFDGTYLSIYINAILTAYAPLSYNRPQSPFRTLNFIGKSNTPGDGYSASFIDDLKFYGIALSESQINMEFIQSGPYQIGSSTYSLLSNYWPIGDVLQCDIINGNMMNLSASVLFAPDRFK